MVSARFYLLKSMDMELEVTGEWLANIGSIEEKIMTQIDKCDSKTLAYYNASNQRVVIKKSYNFLRINGKPAIMGSTIKGIVRKNLISMGNSRSLVDQLLGGEYRIQIKNKNYTEHIESIFSFGNFVYSGNSESDDFKKIYIRNFKNDLYEVAKKGTKFAGKIYCKEIPVERLKSSLQLLLEALNIRGNSTESYRDVYLGRFSNKGSRNIRERVGFPDQQASRFSIFGGVKFRILRGCEV